MILLPLVTPEMLHVDFWLNRASSPDAPLLDDGAITAFDASVRAVTGIPDLFTPPDSLRADDIRARIPGIPTDARFAADGTPLTGAAWKPIRENMVLETMENPAGVRFALTTRRTAVRAVPTDMIASACHHVS